MLFPGIELEGQQLDGTWPREVIDTRWLQVSAHGYGSLGWRTVDWAACNLTGGGLWPAIGKFW